MSVERPVSLALLLALLTFSVGGHLLGVNALPILTYYGATSKDLAILGVTPISVGRSLRVRKEVTASNTPLLVRGGGMPTIDSDIGAIAVFPPDPLTIFSYMGAAVLGAMTVVLVRKVPRSEGQAPAVLTNWLPFSTRGSMVVFHLAYLVHCLMVIRFMPKTVKDIVFSPRGVIALGTIFPVVESINASCADIDADNNTWLMYWIMHGAFSSVTEFFDILAEKYPRLFQHWYALEFYAFLWLVLPMTDGASLCFEEFTKPLLVPMLRPIKERCEGWLTTVVLAIVNASHLWFVGVFFMALPAALKRAAVVIVGTAYPVLASVVSIANAESARWLTYWSCFSLLFLSMICVEKYVGQLPGLYTVCLAGTLYLMLPIFNGSDAVFRNILVPLFRQREALIVKDARELAKTLVKQLPPDRHKAAQEAAAAAFLEQASEPAS